jgi:phosphatidate cytidylyltransferase
MKRLLTSAVAIPIALAAIFLLPDSRFLVPDVWFFAVVAVSLGVAAFEYLKIVRPYAPRAPLGLLLAAVPAAALALSYGMVEDASSATLKLQILVGFALLSVGIGTLVLLGRTPLAETVPALGIYCFGIPYFAVPIASLHRLHQLDPWWIVLTVGLVSFGDSAAYYVGSKLGRHKMAPAISPKKSWEGAVAGFAGSLVWAAAWSRYRLGHFDAQILALAALAAVAGQVGDLVESMIKRGAGVKDSGSVLPGHGGILDRMDATLFAAPVMLTGLWLLGLDGVS